MNRAHQIFCIDVAYRDDYALAAGMDLKSATSHIQKMHGKFRIPTLLKQVDRLSRVKTDS